MKVAVLLFGQPRFFELTKKFIKDEFDLPGHEVDYFVHFWDKIGYIPNGTEELYDKDKLYDSIKSTLPNVRNILIQSYDQEENCSNLTEMCQNLIYFANKLHNRRLPIGTNIESLYYKFGQHWSMKRCFDRIQNYEKKNNFKYDLIIKCRTDIVYRSKKTYPSEKEYYDTKNDYYFNLDFDKPSVKSTALRFLDLTAKMDNKAKDGFNQVVNKFYKNRFKLMRDKNAGWLSYVDNYNIRLAFNDWSLIANREGAQIMFGNWFENYFLTLSKDIKNTPSTSSSFFISQSDHCLQGQFLLNYDLQAERLYDRRDVRLLHPEIIKHDVSTDGKILAYDEKYIDSQMYKKWTQPVKQDLGGV